MPLRTSALLTALIAFVRHHAQLICFALIGIANTLIHGGILILSVEQLRLNVTLAHLLAFCCANIFSYLMNSWLTFKTAISVSRYARFFFASMLALGLTLVISWLADLYELSYLIGFILIVFLVPFINFLTMKFWAFSKSSDSSVVR